MEGMKRNETSFTTPEISRAIAATPLDYFDFFIVENFDNSHLKHSIG